MIIHALCAAMDSVLAARSMLERARTEDVVSPANLVVVGDVLLDREAVGSTQRLCPDAPAPVIDVERVDDGPGGAGLAAVLGAGADVAVTLIAPSRTTRQGSGFAPAWMRPGSVSSPGARGSDPDEVPDRIADRSRGPARRGRPGHPTRATAPAGDGRALQEADAILVSCYGAGTSSMAPLRRAPLPGRTGARDLGPAPARCVAHPGCALGDAQCGGSGGGERPIGRPPAGPGSRARPAMALRCGVRHGWRRGVWLARASGDVLRIPAPSARRRLVRCRGPLRISRGRRAGAGQGARRRRPAGRCRGLGVGRGWRGQRPSGRLRCCPGGPYGPAGPVRRCGSVVTRLGEAAVMGLAREVHARGGTLVATGGCFDVLHAGHVQSLRAARALWVTRWWSCSTRTPGPSAQEAADPCRRRDRAQVLLALDAVDAVVIFDEDEPSAALDPARRVGQGRRLRRNRPPGSGPGPQLGRAGPAPAAPAGAVDSDPQGCGVVLHDRNA